VTFQEEEEAMKRLFPVISLLVAASMLLAACGGAAPAAYQCTDSIGCVTVGPNDPVHIAYALVISGANESLGVDSRNGIEIAIDDAGGKILNHDVKFDGEDEGCSAEGGQAAGTKLAADPTIVAVIGTSCSSAARTALPLLSKAGFVTVSPSNTAPDLTEPGSENNYVPAYARTAHNDKLQGKVAAEYAYNELKVTAAATIHDGSLYADQLQQVFAASFKALGGTITAQEAVDPNQTDMKSVLTTIATGNPQIIYFPIFLPAGGFVIRQAKQTSGLENAYLMGADGLFSPDVVTAAGPDVEGFHVSSPVISGSAYDAFVAKYKAKFATEPISIFHAHSYDAFNIIKAAIEKVAVQDSDGTLHIPRSALQQAVLHTTGFVGLTGTLKCDESTDVKNPGDCAAAGIGVYEYHADQYPPTLVWTPQ
jgi:branched-chain amino acid transport system substrate-binding protein